jgi:hypothetical protein
MNSNRYKASSNDRSAEPIARIQIKEGCELLIYFDGREIIKKAFININSYDNIDINSGDKMGTETLKMSPKVSNYT